MSYLPCQLEPLVNICPKTFQNKISLSTPLFANKEPTEDRCLLDLLALLGEAEILLKKEKQPKPSWSLSLLEDSSKPKVTRARVEGVLQAMEYALFQHETKMNLKEFMLHYGLNKLFPLCSSRIGMEIDNEESCSIFGHYKELSTYNQVVGLGLQLQHDLDLPNHKYIAHQLALLYQSLNQNGKRFSKYKPRVEEKFDIIKSTIGEAKNGKQPVFRQDQKKWLNELTTDIIQNALFSGRLGDIGSECLTELFQTEKK